MTNEKDKAPERVWINSLPESGRVTAYVSPIREVGSGRSLSLAEYVRADPLAAWLPIATNPKDETWQIVAKFDNGKMVWWQRAYWSNRRSHWKTERGYCEPTHWTPLPAAPATENRKGEG